MSRNYRYNKGKLGTIYTRRIGNWGAAEKFFGDLGFNIKDSVRRAQKEEVVEFKKALIHAIVTQAYVNSLWPRLATKTRYNKKDNKTLVYMDTEKYVNSIVVKSDGKDLHQVTFKRGVSYKRKGQRTVTLEQVSRWMEYGTRRMPARPLWEPTLKKRGGARGMRDRVTEKLYRKLKILAAGTGIRIDKAAIRRRY